MIVAPLCNMLVKIGFLLNVSRVFSKKYFGKIFFKGLIYSTLSNPAQTLSKFKNEKVWLAVQFGLPQNFS
jgi:hypothetical protein